MHHLTALIHRYCQQSELPLMFCISPSLQALYEERLFVPMLTWLAISKLLCWGTGTDVEYLQAHRTHKAHA